MDVREVNNMLTSIFDRHAESEREASEIGLVNKDQKILEEVRELNNKFKEKAYAIQDPIRIIQDMQRQ